MNDDAATTRLTRLWVDHKPAVEAFLRRRVPADAVDDCVQATFLVAVRRVDTVPDGAGELPWLFATAHRVLLARHRDEARYLRLTSAVAAAPAAREASTAAEHRGTDRVALARAWDALGEDDREALALVAWDGLTGAQAGAVLGIGRGAFAMRLVRARRHLAALLADDADAPEPSAPAPRPASEPVLLVSRDHRASRSAAPVYTEVSA